MSGRYHHRQCWQSIVTVAFASIAMLTAPPDADAQTPKDCVALMPGQPEPVHEGRYNILCVRPQAGPLRLVCRLDGVPGPSNLLVHPHEVAGAEETSLSVTGDGGLPLIEGMAGAAAHVFFSYDGPFNPVHDKYTLTCRW